MGLVAFRPVETTTGLIKTEPTLIFIHHFPFVIRLSILRRSASLATLPLSELQYLPNDFG